MKDLSKDDLCPSCNKGVLVPKSIPDIQNDEFHYYSECQLCGHTSS